MTDEMHRDLDRETARLALASLAAADATIARKYLDLWEREDFTHWVDQSILDALRHCKFPGKGNSLAIVVQLHHHLMGTGQYKGTNDWLRNEINDMVSREGQPLMLPHLHQHLMEARYHRAGTELETRVGQHAGKSSVEELDQVVKTGLDEMRRVRMRIPASATATITSIKGRTA